jgi:nitrogenase iron protein NifH
LKFAPLTYIVTSGEMATMVQAMKIAQSVDAVGKRGVDVGIAGIINNMRGVPNEKEIVEEAFGAVGLPVIHHVPRSSTVQEAENLKKTVIFAFPESEQAKHFMELAEKIRDNEFTHPLKREILSKAEIQAIANKNA